MRFLSSQDDDDGSTNTARLIYRLEKKLKRPEYFQIGFFFEYPSGQYDVVKHDYVYIFEDLVADIGGYLVSPINQTSFLFCIY